MKSISEDPDSSEKRWIAEKRAEDIYRMVTSTGSLQSTSTDKHGRFMFRNLRVGEKYLVVAADLVADKGIVLTHQIVGPLSPGNNKIRLVNDW